MDNQLQRVCPQCGTLVDGNFCPECGIPVQNVQQAPPPYQPPQDAYQQQPQGAYQQQPQGAYQPPQGTYQPPPQGGYYQQPVVINNYNTPVMMMGRPKDKWVAFLLCFFLGYLGIHKFYEGKVGMGILYILTGGLFGIGWFVDWIVLLCKPNPYYVR